MGYEKISQKLTFYKAFFSPQWKFLIHTNLQCLSSKTTAHNEFSSTMASAIICLTTNWKFNFSKYIFKSMVKNLDNVFGKFLMYPRFVQVFMNQQLDGMPTHKRIYDAPSHIKKKFGSIKRVGKGFSGRVTPLFPKMVVQNQAELGEDEDVHKELGNSLVRAATTTSSLEAEYDSGNITKTRSKATPNEAGSQGTTLGGGPKCQETIGDTIAQTRFENVSKLSNDPLLARGNTLRSGEDSLKLNELMELCTILQTRVLDLEKTKTTQQNEIASLKRRVEKLEQKKRSRTHGLKRLYKVGLSARVESSRDEEDLGEDASKQGMRINAIDADEDITLASVQDDAEMFDVNTLTGDEVFGKQEVTAKDVNLTVDEVTLAQALAALKSVKPKLAERLQAEEQEQFTIEEKATLFKELLEKRRKHFAAKRAEEELEQEITKKRENLEDLYKLVKARYGSTRPVEDLDLVSWNDLKTMFEPHVEDKIWKLQQRYQVLSWKLFNSCGVHCLSLQFGMIFILVEKRYPFTPPRIIDMLNKKLQGRIVRIKSLLNAVSITTALIDVNVDHLKLVLLENFNENYSKCLRLLYKVNAAEGVNVTSKDVSTAELVSTAYCQHKVGEFICLFNTLRSGEDSLKLNELMELCTILQTRVLDLEKTKTTQQNEIASLKRRVEKLKQKKRSRTHGLKRLYKVGLSARVESSKDEEDLGEDASKQGMRINAIDADEDITLASVQEDAEMFDVNTLTGDEVFAKQEVTAKDVNLTVDEVTLAQALAALKSVKPKLFDIKFYLFDVGLR
ncbi:hypothetical protein Tco_1130813 [Tanacetum coccineum]